MGRNRMVFACACFLLLATSRVALATGGRLSGRVTNGAGVATPYAKVVWGGSCPVGVIPGHTYTDVNGLWSSPVLTNGKYSVGAGLGPCTKNVYLCGSSNTKTIISDADVTGVDFVRDVQSVSGTIGMGGYVGFVVGTSADRPAITTARGAFHQDVPCGDTLNVWIGTEANYVLASVIVDGVDRTGEGGFSWPNNQSSHTVSATFTPYTPPTTGACCMWGNPTTCTERTPEECAAVGGGFMGLGTSCVGGCLPVKARRSTWGGVKAIYR